MTGSETLEVDAVGATCPEPVLLLGRAIKANRTRPLTVQLVADDPTTVHDIPAWCRMTGATLDSQDSRDGLFAFVIVVTD